MLIKPCHTMPRFHCICMGLFNFPEQHEIARKLWYLSWKWTCNGVLTATKVLLCSSNGVLLLFYRVIVGHCLCSHSPSTACTTLSRRRISTLEPASVAQLDAPSDWRPEGRGFNPRRGRQQFFVEIDHEIFSTVILSLPLIQEGQLSVSGERMCTILVNRLED